MRAQVFFKILKKYWIILFLFSLNCSVDSARNHYVLAEKLWTDKKYNAAISEFEKVTSKDPKGKLGLQALYRAATTQTLFLKQYVEAIQKFKTFVQQSSDSPSVWDAQLQIGDILFTKIDQYNEAVSHYERLLQIYPQAAEVPEFLFRIAKSHFYLFHFEDSIRNYQKIIARFPDSSWAEQASFEIGSTYFTQGAKQPEGKSSATYQRAMEAYEKFMREYPKSTWVVQARFGIASCLEELDRVEEALSLFSALEKSYPSPNVIQIKKIRIKERMAQKNQRH